MRLMSLACMAVTGLLPALALGQDSPFALARQVTGSITIDPSFSPDGARMVYITAVAGVQQLSIAKPDGSEPKQITHDAFDHEDPAWSPDGKSIAFVSYADGGQVISVMATDGSGVQAVTSKDVHAIHPNWTADSKSLLYCTTDDLDPPRKNGGIFAIEIASNR
jgi:TolB protein